MLREQVSFEQLVVEAMGQPGDPVLSDLDDEALVHEVRVQAAEVAAATCRWLLLVAELVRRGIWARQEAKTPAVWLAWATQLAGSTAREHVRVALALREFPQVTEAFAAGELSYSQVRAMTRYGDPALQRQMLSYARYADASQLERILGSFRASVSGQARPSPYAARRCEVRQVDHQTGELRLRGPRELIDHAALTLDRWAQTARAADRQAATQAATDDDAAEPVELEPVGAYRADALLAAIEALAADQPTDTSGLERHTVVIHTHTDRLDNPADTPTPVTVARGSRTRATSMSPRALQRLLCTSATITVGHDTHGQVCTISAKTRQVPPTLLRVLHARDRRCRFPGCGSTRFLQAHHIRHVEHGGRTRLHNLLLLCARHHHAVHDHGWTIDHDGHGHVRFHRDGQPLAPTLPLPGAHPHAASARNRASGLPQPPPDLLQPDDWQPHIDLDTCIQVLHQEIARAQPPTTTLAA